MKKQIIFPLLKEICLDQNITFIEEPSRGVFGALIFDNGKKFFIKDVNFNINYVSSVSVTRNKALTSFFLNKYGYNAPEFTMVCSEVVCKKNNSCDTLQNGLHFANKIGYPVILKLNGSSQGRGVYKVFSDDELIKKSKLIFENHDTFQIQKYYPYNDYRIVVLGDKVISAYQRIHFTVVGNGVSTINQLIDEKQKFFKKCGRDTVLKVDEEIYENLSRLGYNLETILAVVKKCILRSVSNLSAGGECLDLTNKLHKDYINLCLKIAKDFNLNLCGIDIMCQDLTRCLDDYVILEINSSPGLDNYAFIGEAQELYVKNLYRQVVLYLKEKSIK